MIRQNLVRQVAEQLENSFEYLHYNTIIRYCKISGLNKLEQLEVYNLVEYKIKYSTII